MSWVDEYKARYRHHTFGQAEAVTIYCMTEGWGEPVKIGFTWNLSDRFAAIRTNTWRDMFVCWAVVGVRAHEKALKRFFQPLAVNRDEWFHDPDDTIKTALKANSTVADLDQFINRLAGPDEPVIKPREPRRPARGGVVWLMPKSFEVVNQSRQTHSVPSGPLPVLAPRSPTGQTAFGAATAVAQGGGA